MARRDGKKHELPRAAARGIAAVVLGCRPYLNDGSVNPELSLRVGKAIELYQRGFVDILLFSGGPNFSSMPEALVMKSMAKMIPKENIIVEIHSRSTKENAVLSKRILLRKGIRDIVVVTSPYHAKRALLTFQGVFGPAFSVQAVKSDFYLPVHKTAWKWIIEHLKALNMFPERFLQKIA